MVSTCKVNREADDTSYNTTATGVILLAYLGTHLSRLQSWHQLQRRVLENLSQELNQFRYDQGAIRKNQLSSGAG